MPSLTRYSVTLIAVTALLAASGPAAAQTRDGPSACAGPESHRFDFRAGTWDVDSQLRTEQGWVDTTATWTAREILGGCAFIDFARADFGDGPLRGMGSRYFEPGSGTWYMTWLSTQAPGQLGIWEGGFHDDGTATFRREVPTPGGTVLSRIRWWDIRDDSAEWEHAISSDDGDSWQPTWRMTFRRAQPGSPGTGDADAGAESTQREASEQR